MVVYRLTLSYLGTAYAGWQRQTNALAVQQVVEEALARLVGHPTPVLGASRTDAGVHARGQVAHLELSRPFPEGGLVHGTNRLLPPDIRILDARRMAPGFHARKDALGKEYAYRLIRCRVLSPLDAVQAVRVEPDIDVAAMRRAAVQVLGRHDFTAFALSGGAHGQPFRTVSAADWVEEGARLRFHVVGDGFLRGMVRSLVGTLLEVGRRRRTPDSMARLLTGRPRAEAGPTAPARGLILERVFYPEEAAADDSVPQSTFFSEENRL